MTGSSRASAFDARPRPAVRPREVGPVIVCKRAVNPDGTPVRVDLAGCEFQVRHEDGTDEGRRSEPTQPGTRSLAICPSGSPSCCMRSLTLRTSKPLRRLRSPSSSGGRSFSRRLRGAGESIWRWPIDEFSETSRRASSGGVLEGHGSMAGQHLWVSAQNEENWRWSIQPGSFEVRAPIAPSDETLKGRTGAEARCAERRRAVHDVLGIFVSGSVAHGTTNDDTDADAGWCLE
jgi:hypothetical protein